ncbi:hypothetical protein TICRE_13950 [Tissierella creatinophila DSM 6911]|uniref:Uncharacterized protein n=1 Tax=Tissierella creatinophila DSM 6911 TaxID=1123403 RepID=A0A1U7M5J3_TISCR|nr:hypothetical protein TICRE_13950 [Tissierella creatinophila DSM 6911]
MLYFPTNPPISGLTALLFHYTPLCNYAKPCTRVSHHCCWSYFFFLHFYMHIKSPKVVRSKVSYYFFIIYTSYLIYNFQVGIYYCKTKISSTSRLPMKDLICVFASVAFFRQNSGRTRYLCEEKT